MQVSGLDKDGDWRFGRGRAIYLTRSNAIAQDVLTRIRSFTADWYLDQDAGINWIGLLGKRGVTGAEIQKEVERVTLETENVVRVDAASVSVDRVNRRATINITYTDIFGVQMQLPGITI